MRRVRAATALGALVLVACPAVAGAGPLPEFGIVYANAPPGTPLRELGYQLYAGNCSTCHGSNGQGILQAPPGQGSGEIHGRGPSLRDAGALSADFYLRTGRMPIGYAGQEPLRSRVLFTDHQIRALVDYVGSLGGPPIPTPHPEQGNLASGMRLFAQHCAGCHQIAAAGGYLTGGVAVPLDRATPVEVAEAVRIGPFLMPSFSKRHISDKQLDSIISYVQYTQHPQDEGGWALGHVGPVPEGLVTWWIAGVALVGLCLVIGRRLRR